MFKFFLFLACYYTIGVLLLFLVTRDKRGGKVGAWGVAMMIVAWPTVIALGLIDYWRYDRKKGKF